MKQSERTRERLMAHCRRYPALEMGDLFKYIYQSALGCEHMVSSLPGATEYIRREWESGLADRGDMLDVLDGDYSRVHLAYLDRGLRAETLGRLFFLSAVKEERGREAIEEKLAMARALAGEGALPFSADALEGAIGEWRAAGYPAIHHSEAFRACYHPAYRVIANRYVPFLPLFERIDAALERGAVTLAIEGGSAGGKTTLGEMLESLYDCTVFHMDDFFLRPEQRTAARYAEVGGNVDRERFLEEVLIPHSKGETVRYRRFDCGTFTLCPPIEVIPKKLTVIEGAYSMHPELASYYDLSVFLDISPEAQRARIEKRNSPAMAERFFGEWIPLEHKYFKEMKVKERCDLSVSVCQ